MADPARLFDLTGKIAAVTGAGAGLGRRAATTLADAGASVIAVGRRRDQLLDWQGETAGKTHVIDRDLADRSKLAVLAADIAGPFGDPDILINAAAIVPGQSADDLTPEDWDNALSLDLATPFFLSRALVPAMRSRGWGRILNLAGLPGARELPAGTATATARAGLAELTRAMARAWSPDGVIVNAIAPGIFETGPDSAAASAAQTCIGRAGTEEDLDGPVLFFCSEASRYVTGQVLPVDGGFTAK